MKIVFFLPFILSLNLFAGYISIPLEDPEYKLTPASDLQYKNEVLTATEAMELSKKGYDLSKLNPKVSSLYLNKKLAIKTSNPIKKHIEEHPIEFHSSLTAPTEFYRGSVNIDGQNFTISASLYNHQTLLRAAILRLIGYDVEMPEYLHSFEMKFENIEQKKTFVETLVQTTLLSQSRWLVDINEATDSQPRLRLKGFIIEPAELKNVSVYWPVMEQSRQIARRVYRSLFYLYCLTDFEEQTNLVNWEFGQVFNNELNLNHNYFYAFTHVTIEDIKWIHSKISSLTELEIKAAVNEAKWPFEVGEILFQKLKSRINSISKKLSLPQTLKVDEKINIIGVVNGKLNIQKYPDYVPSFYEEDPLSPFRFSEVFKLFRSQITYDTLSKLLDSAQKKFIPNLTNSEAAKKISEKIRNSRNQDGSIPLQFWTAPIAKGSVSGNRSIVFGQYQGSNAPIQLVDNVAIEFEAGIFGLVAGLPSSIKPNVIVKASIKRSWNHAKAMPDLSTATEQSVSKIYVPSLINKLAGSLTKNQKCSIEKQAWYAEEVITTFKTWVVYYDKDQTTGKEAALKLREELIENGVQEDRIIFSAISKETLCAKEITEKTNSNLEEFIKEFAMDETITITDSIQLGSQAGIKYDPSMIDELTAEINAEKSKAVIRSTIIRKNADGFEITIQKQNNNKRRYKVAAEFFIDIFSYAKQKEKGSMLSKVYKMKLVDITEEEKIAAINTLREILIRGSFDNLSNLYNPTILDHDIEARLGTFKLLWKKYERLKMNHEVEITVANKPHNIKIKEVPIELDEWSVPAPLPANLPLRDRQRTLYNVLDIKRTGKNYHSFLDKALNQIAFDWLNLGSNDQDPGRSIYGKSKSKIYITEVELTSQYDAKPITRVEYRYTGWKARNGKLDRIFDDIKELYDFKEANFRINRSLFNQTKRFYSYDIRSTIILYPSAIARIENELISAKYEDKLKTLKSFYGKKRWEEQCYQDLDCLPSGVHTIYKMLAKKLPEDRKEYAHIANKIFRELFEDFNKAKVLKWIGLKNFFSTTYISGFRSEDSEGYLQYTTDSVGTFQEEYGTGTFDYISTNLGISAYTIKAMNYTPGME